MDIHQSHKQSQNDTGPGNLIDLLQRIDGSQGDLDENEQEFIAGSHLRSVTQTWNEVDMKNAVVKQHRDDDDKANGTSDNAENRETSDGSHASKQQRKRDQTRDEESKMVENHQQLWRRQQPTPACEHHPGEPKGHE